jgi:Transglycosylase SLT domain
MPGISAQMRVAGSGGLSLPGLPVMRFARRVRPFVFFALLLSPAACMDMTGAASDTALPVMAWDTSRPAEAADWTKATLDALRDEGAVLASTVPMDVAHFCPSYVKATPDDRRAFWAGLFSAIARFESTWNPNATGGGGRYLGLLQISPVTAQYVGCDLSQGGLHDGEANLACAVRIAADRAPAGGGAVTGNGALAGIVNAWGPMHDSEKVAQVAAFTSAQSYCN